MKKRRILNIGCGKTRIPNSLGLDIAPIPEYVDVVHDLNVFPYPFSSASFEEIHMYHILEHLEDPLKVLQEVYRLLKPGGYAFIRVPHFSSKGAFTDITHKRPFGYNSFDCLEKQNAQHYYTMSSFFIEEKEIRYLGLLQDLSYHGTQSTSVVLEFAKLVERGMNLLIRLSPLLFERLWCYWVGGATEVYIKLRKEE
ncbi:class I SAM-dependent methyltransferase [Candidatus Roizmanbacteria bacterium]|nr:class I SAM-dependent methyltransferase [Candidatus Roizmanbacteria bacterium]